MKKILLIFIILLLNFNIARASSNTQAMCVQPYDLSCGVSRFVSVATGSNFLATRVAETLLKKELKKNINGKLSIKISSFSVKDLKKGIFKSMSLSGKNVDMAGVHFSVLNLSTMCNFNYISLIDSKNPVVKEDIPLAFYVVMTEDDINNTMKSEGYQKVIEDLNMLGSSIGIFRISSGKIKIKDNKFYYVLKIYIPFVKNPQNVVLMSDLKVSRGQIDLTDTKLINNNFLIDLKQLDRVINYINPLDFSLNILENKHADLTVQNIQIRENKIYASGIIIVPKDGY